MLEALTYWVRSALGHPNAFEFVSEGKQAADGGQTLFPDNPARRASVKGKQERPRPEGRKIAKLGAPLPPSHSLLPLFAADLLTSGSSSEQPPSRTSRIATSPSDRRLHQPSNDFQTKRIRLSHRTRKPM